MMKPNFEIPAGYSKEFAFYWRGKLASVIVANSAGIDSRHLKSDAPQGVILDWIQETIERVRFECEQ